MACSTSSVFVCLILLSSVLSIEFPRNVVVLSGRDWMMDCAKCDPFRWYRYLLSDPTDDKVIFMGSRIADGMEERFRVYKEPKNYPFTRLNLLITGVQTTHFGTYKCQAKSSAYCAELIVLDTEPFCEIQREEEEGKTKEEVLLKCSFNVSANAEPEMLCLHTGNAIPTNCSVRSNSSEASAFVCTTSVPVDMHEDFFCIIKFDYIILRRYATCNHANNRPDYTYIWRPSSTLSMMLSTTEVQKTAEFWEVRFLNKSASEERQLFLIVLAVAGLVILILIAIMVGQRVGCQRRKKDDCKYATPEKSSVEIRHDQYTSLAIQVYEEIPAESPYHSVDSQSPYHSVDPQSPYHSVDPQFLVAPYAPSKRS